MNNHWTIKKISELTEHWKLKDWCEFRSLNRYWEVKDGYYKDYYNPKTKKFNNMAESRWLVWKLEALVEYLN